MMLTSLIILTGLLQTSASALADEKVVDRMMDLTRCANATAAKLDDDMTQPDLLARAAIAECFDETERFHRAVQQQVSGTLRTHSLRQIQSKSDATVKQYYRTIEDQIILNVLRTRAAKR